MATPTYVPLATYTVPGGGLNNVTFSSIPATYRDLVIVIAGSVSTTTSTSIRLNGDTGTNYFNLRVLNFSSILCDSYNTAYLETGNISTAQATIKINLLDYSATDKHKTTLCRFDETSRMGMMANRWANTSAVTQVQVLIENPSAVYNAGTVMSLYGVN